MSEWKQKLSRFLGSGVRESDGMHDLHGTLNQKHSEKRLPLKKGGKVPGGCAIVIQLGGLGGKKPKKGCYAAGGSIIGGNPSELREGTTPLSSQEQGVPLVGRLKNAISQKTRSLSTSRM